ncbi:MAG: outer membrane protein assembly factor BamE [Salaquimonas sp.]|jgi:outer membrane protein assembly factor BamE (lipoprotein component of BamABCDE complex)|nr:outer membrane protein assembly factor BamE [Salaquimonas sp.]
MKHSRSTGNRELHKSVRIVCTVLALSAAGTGLWACNTSQVFTHGAVITQEQIDLIPIGSSKDQVLLALGSPSTTGQFDNEVFYYISQRTKKTYAFQKAKLVDQRVLAVYFDDTDTVSQVANYGLKDGKVFDFIARTTPTGGRDLTFLGQILQGPGDKSIRPNATPSSIPGSKL